MTFYDIAVFCCSRLIYYEYQCKKWNCSTNLLARTLLWTAISYVINHRFYLIVVFRLFFRICWMSQIRRVFSIDITSILHLNVICANSSVNRIAIPFGWQEIQFGKLLTVPTLCSDGVRSRKVFLQLPQQ